jgi:hypothetical protein
MTKMRGGMEKVEKKHEKREPCKVAGKTKSKGE